MPVPSAHLEKLENLIVWRAEASEGPAWADDPEGRAQVSAFVGALQEREWKLGGNLQIDYRWSAGDSSRYRSYAAELVAQAPDLLLGVGGTVVGALQRATRDVPMCKALGTWSRVLNCAAAGGKWVSRLGIRWRVEAHDRICG